MAILRKSDKPMTTATIYNMTSSNGGVGKMSSLAGSVVDVQDWIIYEDSDKVTGEVKKILSIRTPENEIYATNSKNILNGFENLLDAYAVNNDTWNGKLEIMKGKTRNGRDFYMCKPMDN